MTRTESLLLIFTAEICGFATFFSAYYICL